MLAIYLGGKSCDVFSTGTRTFIIRKKPVLDVLDIEYIGSYLNLPQILGTKRNNPGYQETSNLTRYTM